MVWEQLEIYTITQSDSFDNLFEVIYKVNSKIRLTYVLDNNCYIF